MRLAISPLYHSSSTPPAFLHFIPLPFPCSTCVWVTDMAVTKQERRRKTWVSLRAWGRKPRHYSALWLWQGLGCGRVLGLGCPLGRQRWWKLLTSGLFSCPLRSPMVRAPCQCCWWLMRTPSPRGPWSQRTALSWTMATTGKSLSGKVLGAGKGLFTNWALAGAPRAWQPLSSGGK